MIEQFGRLMIIVGGVLIVSGLIFIAINRLINIKDFPGTIKIESGNFSLFIPVLACILISILLTIAINIILRIINR